MKSSCICGVSPFLGNTQRASKRTMAFNHQCLRPRVYVSSTVKSGITNCRPSGVNVHAGFVASLTSVRKPNVSRCPECKAPAFDVHLRSINVFFLRIRTLL